MRTVTRFLPVLLLALFVPQHAGATIDDGGQAPGSVFAQAITEYINGQIDLATLAEAYQAVQPPAGLSPIDQVAYLYAVGEVDQVSAMEAYAAVATGDPPPLYIWVSRPLPTGPQTTPIGWWIIVTGDPTQPPVVIQLPPFSNPEPPAPNPFPGYYRWANGKWNFVPVVPIL